MKGQVIPRGKSWSAVVFLGRVDGKKRYQWKSFPTKKKAQEHLHKSIATLDGGGTLTTTKQTVGEYLKGWLKGLHVAPRTIESYTDTVEDHLIPAFGHIRLAALGPQAIREYAAEKTELSSTTTRYILAVLKIALNQAVRDGLLLRNVAALVKAPPKARREMQILDAKQAALFLGEAKRLSRHYPLYALALTTGLRQGEIAGLRWSDIDFETRRITVSQTYARGRFGGTKTGKVRTVPLSPEVEFLLVQMPRRGPLVFCQPNGRPLHMPSIVRRDFRKILALNGLREELRTQGVAEGALPDPLPQVRFHDLRHTAASLLLARGASVKVVSEVLGHSSAKMTLDVYSHAVQGLAEHAIADLSSALLPSPVLSAPVAAE